LNYGRPKSLPRPPRNNAKLIEVHFLKRIFVFLEKNHGTVHFSLTKISENYKIKNLIEAMLRRLVKMIKQLWDTTI
jgi:hypothetical protein